MAAPRHGDPDSTRQLGRQFMELQRAEQAKHRLGYLDGDRDESLVFRGVCMGQAKEAVANSIKQPGRGEPGKCRARSTQGL